MVRLGRDMDPEGNVLDPIGYIIWSAPWKDVQWEPEPPRERLVRYRRSSNGTYQEVIELANGHIFYGLYMPEGFVPPPGMGE